MKSNGVATTIQLLPTGVPNLDAVLGGGVPVYSLNIIAGPPGSGKTILAQQLLFHHTQLNPGSRGLYLTTLSEPVVKVVRYMQHFSFFSHDVFGDQVVYHDLGRFIRDYPLTDVTDQILELVERHRPDVIIIDSYKAIRDLSGDAGTFRQFCYDLSVRLSSARCTTFLLGEYDRQDIAQGAEFAVADGILYMGLVVQEGDQRRFMQLLKMRGQRTEMAPFPFAISSGGIRIFSSSLTLRQGDMDLVAAPGWVSTGIDGLDALLGGGLPLGYCIIWAGVSGTGKTTCAVQALALGALRGERGLLFSFEEHPERLHRTAAGFGWDLAAFEKQGLLRIVFIPPDTIRVEEHLEEMMCAIEAFQPQRFVVDSFSVFLHKVQDPTVQREKTFQMATLARRNSSVGILISDTPANDPHVMSRFGVEETVADGTVILTAEMEQLQRKRYLEVYKMRAVNHVVGRHRMEIAERGIEVFYASPPDLSGIHPPPRLCFLPVQEALQGALPYGSTWLVQGNPGVGKSTLAYQFAIEGLSRRDSVLYIAADIPADQVRQALLGFGFLPDPYLETGQLTILETFGNDRHTLDPTDPETFLFGVLRQVEAMAKPLRLVFDSFTPLALGYAPGEFVALIHRLVRMLRRPDVTIFGTLLEQTLERNALYSLLNAFDVVIDLFSPDWGDMAAAGAVGHRALRVRKARGVNASPQPYPYTISPAEGVVVHKAFYRA